MAIAIDLTQPHSSDLPRKGTGDEKPKRLTADQKLRKRGYRIVSRPAKGDAVWADDCGRLWKQSQIKEN
jgi:hypothetical protein